MNYSLSNMLGRVRPLGPMGFTGYGLTITDGGTTYLITTDNKVISLN